MYGSQHLRDWAVLFLANGWPPAFNLHWSAPVSCVGTPGDPGPFYEVKIMSSARTGEATRKVVTHKAGTTSLLNILNRAA
jgi:hypothetical protein